MNNQLDREKRLLSLALVPLAILTFFSHFTSAHPRHIVAPNVRVAKVL